MITENKALDTLKALASGTKVSAVKRHSVDFRFDALNWEFIKFLARIAHYAAGKYGSAEQYADGRLEGEKGPINHIYEHLRQYQAGEPHDHFGDPRAHLAAIAYNAMMEYYYHTKWGHKINPLTLPLPEGGPQPPEEK